MNISYIETKSGKKLFSFHRHDFKMEEDVGIDGGFSGYIRVIGNAVLKEDSIKNLIEDIRESFLWSTRYNEDNERLPETKYILLKDLDTTHIKAIVKYLSEKVKDKDRQWEAVNQILSEELNYREKGQQSAEDK